jgi:hypothetical protein
MLTPPTGIVIGQALLGEHIKDVNAEAWHLPPVYARIDEMATVGAWVVHFRRALLPGYRWFAYCIVSLRDMPGVAPAWKPVAETTHEIRIAPLAEIPKPPHFKNMLRWDLKAPRHLKTLIHVQSTDVQLREWLSQMILGLTSGGAIYTDMLERLNADKSAYMCARGDNKYLAPLLGKEPDYQEDW